MDAPPVDPMVGRLLDGRYSVDSFIAHGGMASVYLGTDTRLERRVAVKVLHAHLAGDKETLARFQREARAAARLSHPDVVAVYDQGTDGDRPFLVMEYVPGVNLRAVLRDRGLLSPGEAVAVMDHVLAALAAAHSAGLVHRDIKPENVLLTTDGRVKVADFGLARAVAGSTVTTTGSVLFGTAAYLAPEQFEHGTADERSDVYSSGVLFFELLTGRTPFEGESAYAVLHQHANQTVPAPSTRASGVPPQLDALVTWATSRDPAQRPSDAGELHAALIDVRDKLGLHAAVPGLPVTATSPLAETPGVTTNAVTQAVPAGAAAGAPPPPKKPKRRRGAESASSPRLGRRGWIVAAIVAVAIVVAAVLGWYFALGRYTHTPALLGETRQAANAELTHDGLHMKVLKAVYSSKYAKDQIAVESPGPGSRIRNGGTVSIRLSLGPAHIPAVQGDTVAQATTALQAIGVTVSSDQIKQYDDNLTAGLVIKTSIPAGQQVEAGTSVVLYVSKGPRPVDVPTDLVNKPVADATAELIGLGFVVDASHTAFSDTVPKGAVISVKPDPGSPAHAGDRIKLTVSNGPEFVEVPDVRGESLGQAIADLKSAGFKVDPREFAPGGPQQVFRYTPDGMQKVGTTIEIDYY